MRLHVLSGTHGALRSGSHDGRARLGNILIGLWCALFPSEHKSLGGTEVVLKPSI